MTSKETLSADLDLVKEVEQLRIKQKLLISALEKEKDQEKNQQLSEISSKIDFIVEIFKNASGGDDSQKEEDIQTSILEKLDDVLSTVEKRFDELETKISKFDQKPKSVESQTSTQQQSASQSKMPPPPEFSSKQDSNSKTQDTQSNNGEVKEKKKGFFSK